MTLLLDPERLTPTQELVLEVLAARYRAGETTWTFGTRHRHTIQLLESLGYVWWKSGIIYGTLLAGLTPDARAVCLSADYTPPNSSK